MVPAWGLVGEAEEAGLGHLHTQGEGKPRD